MDFRILGPLEVVQEGRSLPIGAAKQRALLAILLLHPNETVSVDRLIDLLWSEEPPDTASNTLQVYVSGLRKVLEPARSKGAPGSLVVRRSPGYALEVEPHEVDALRFERLVSKATSFPPEQADERSAVLREALALWRGPALADFAYEPFAQAEVSRLEELRMEALEARIGADLALGRHATLVGELESLAALHPLRETLRAQQMLALYRSGRQAEALAVYADTRRVLDEELGIDPSARLQQLEQQILLQDEALEPPRVAAGGNGQAPTQARRGPGRKVVSILCCEVDVGSSLDPEVRDFVIDRLHALALSMMQQHGASTEVTPGDEVIGVFGVPSVHEDDATRAARAAEDVLNGLTPLRRELQGAADASASLGIATGEVLTKDGRLPRGQVLKAAAELARRAGPNEVLVSKETRRHLGFAAETRAARKGLSGDEAFTLVGPVRSVRDSGRKLNVPMVGRRDELDRLLRTYEHTVAERKGQLFTLLGAAGVGKSRLLAEFVRALAGRAEVLSTRCPPYGEGVAFLPAGDVVRQATRVDAELEREEALARIDSVLGDQRDAAAIASRLAEMAGFAEVEGPLEELSWAFRKLLESLARRRPVVVVLDDVHWADPSLLNIVEHVSDRVRSVPVLLVCSARSEFLEDRPSWNGGKDNASSALLEPLSDRECLTLLTNLFGEQEAPAHITQRIVEAAEGNPLFVEEMVRMLVDDGLLRCEAGRWIATGDVSTVTIPPTIHGLIAARLERLDDRQRSVLQRAALVGRDFDRAVVEHLCEPATRASVDAFLRELVGKELIRPYYAEGRDEERYRFRHILIRDSAYAQMPKQLRAELHLSVAERLSSAEVPGELVAFHLERAFGLRRQLQLPESETEVIGMRAAQLLAASARSAAGRGDLRGAATLLDRAIQLVAPGEELRAACVLDLADVLGDLGDLKRAAQLLRDLLAEERLDPLHAARARIQLWEIRSSSENFMGWKEEATRDVREALELFERHEDRLGSAKALNLRALIDEYDYRFGESSAALEVALEHARAAHNEREETKIFHAYLRSSLFGPVHVDIALDRYRQFRDRFPDNRLVESNCLRGMALLHAMKGDFEDARSLLEEYRRLLGDLGLEIGASKSLAPGMAEMVSGNLAKAERTFLESYEELGRLGERNTRAITAAYLARVIYDQGRYDEAFAFTRASEKLAPDDDFATMIEWASVRAKVLARRGAYEEADRISRQVIGLAARTDELETRATTAMDRAEVLRLAGRSEEAGPCIAEALELYARKGDLASAARARRVLEEIGPPALIDLREQATKP